MKFLVYDCEIVNAIPNRLESPLDGIRYAEGWTDFAGMGVSVIAAYIWSEGYRIFLHDNFETFKTLAEDSQTLCIGFNNRTFDDRLVAAAIGCQIPPDRSWDLSRALKVARGNNPDAAGGGCSLDVLCKANFLPGKSGSGAFAPILWQKGKFGQVIDYALNDTAQTVRLLEFVMAGRLRDPNSGRVLAIALPGSGTPP